MLMFTFTDEAFYVFVYCVSLFCVTFRFSAAFFQLIGVNLLGVGKLGHNFSPAVSLSVCNICTAGGDTGGCTFRYPLLFLVVIE